MKFNKEKTLELFGYIITGFVIICVIIAIFAPNLYTLAFYKITKKEQPIKTTAIKEWDNPRYTVTIYKPIEKTFENCEIENFISSYPFEGRPFILQLIQNGKQIYVHENWIAIEE